MSAAYRARPLLVEAIRWDGENTQQLKALLAARIKDVDADGGVTFEHPSRLGTIVVYAPQGWWIVLHAHGLVVSMHPDRFDREYEPAT